MKKATGGATRKTGKYLPARRTTTNDRFEQKMQAGKRKVSIYRGTEGPKKSAPRKKAR